MKHEMLHSLGLDNGVWAYYELSEEEFQTLHFLENGRELWYNQKIHDVLSIERINGKVQIIALPDEEETSLLRLMSKVNDRNNKNEHQGALFFAFCGVVNEHEFPELIDKSISNLDFYSILSSIFFLFGRNMDIDAPPPQIW